MCKGANISDVQERLKEIGQHMHNRSISLKVLIWKPPHI